MTLAAFRRSVLIDSSANLALLDPKDRNHSLAIAIQRRLAAERWRTYTTNFLLAESHALVLNRLNRRTATIFLSTQDEAITAGFLALVRIEPDDEVRARNIIARYDDKDFSLTDALSFAVMERAGIAAAFSFDSDFRQYGLDVLSPNT